MLCKSQVCYFVKFNDWQENETKEVKLKTTKHDITLRIDVTNKPLCTYFGCLNWRALCKAYALEEGMKITFDLGPSRRDVFKNKDIWMLVDDKKLVLSQREFNFLTIIYLFPFLIFLCFPSRQLCYNCQFISMIRWIYARCLIMLSIMHYWNLLVCR